MERRTDNPGTGYVNQAGRNNNAEEPTKVRHNSRKKSDPFSDAFTKVLNIFGAIFCPIKKDKKK